MRRRRGEGVAEPEPQESPVPMGDTSPQVEMRMRGTAEQVKKQLVAETAKPEERKPSDPSEDIEKFTALLRNPKYIVKVKRLRPKSWQGQKANVEVWTSELPLQWEEIKTEVDENYKGGTYKVSVINPETGGVIDARNFEIEGDPLIESVALTPEEQAMFGEKPKDAAQITEEGLERTARMTAKQIEVETLQQNLQQLRNRQTNGGKQSHESDSRIDDLERRLLNAQHQAELEARDRKHDEEMKELRSLIAGAAKPRGDDTIGLILKQMQDQQKASQDQFNALLKQMQDDKMNAVLDELKSIRNRPSGQNGGVAESLQIIREVKKMFGGDDDDDDDEKDDDRPWWERALDKLADKLTEPVIDKLISKLDGIEKGGKEISKEDFLREVAPEIDAMARKVADQELARRQAAGRIPAAPPPAALPPPPAAAKTELPPAPPAGAAPNVPVAEAPPAPAPAAPPPQEMSIAQKICLMAAGAVSMIQSEMALRPKRFEWNYELWSNLPEDMLDRVTDAPDPVSMFDAFKVEGMDIAGIEKFKAEVAANPKAVAWLKIGHDELKDWKKRSAEDPNFDPADDDEEEGEGE